MDNIEPMSERMMDDNEYEDNMEDDFEEDPMDYEELEGNAGGMTEDIDIDMLSEPARNQLKNDVAQTMRVTNLIKEGKSEYYKYPYPDQGIDYKKYDPSTTRDPVAQKREIKYEKEKMKEEPPAEIIKNMLGHLTQTTVSV